MVLSNVVLPLFVEQGPGLRVRVEELLLRLEAVDVQCRCVYGTDNIWIAKPAALSCGRGITVCDSLEQVWSWGSYSAQCRMHSTHSD
jgi:hypothetical protein